MCQRGMGYGPETLAGNSKRPTRPAWKREEHSKSSSGTLKHARSRAHNDGNGAMDRFFGLGKNLSDRSTEGFPKNASNGNSFKTGYSHPRSLSDPQTANRYPPPTLTGKAPTKNQDTPSPSQATATGGTSNMSTTALADETKAAYGAPAAPEPPKKTGSGKTAAMVSAGVGL